MRRKLFAGLGSGLVAGIVIALVLLNVGAPAAQPQPSELGASMGVKLVIEVYRADGTTEKYVKEGDLILENFAKFIAALFSTTDKDPENTEDTIPVKTDGTAWPSNYGFAVGHSSFGIGQICIGNGTESASINDYALDNELFRFDVQDADLSYSGNNITIDVFGSYVTDADTSISEVGLIIKAQGRTSSSVDGSGYIMFFHDVLSEPIQLNAGDGITVHYYIYLINPS